MSRKHCTKDWSDGLAEIRSRILSALQDMPENEEVAKILRGNQIHYYTCLEIIEVLKKTEADSKNIFGYYSSQRMKEWQDIVKMYQKDNLYLAETAQIISRNVIHEIPSIKRTMSKLANVAAECNKKSVDYMKLSSNLNAEYFIAAGKLGIKGDNVEKELLEQLEDFPELIRQIQSKISTSISQPLNFYSNFTKEIGSDRADVLPIVKYLIDRGNTTVYELRRGEKPLSVITKFEGDPNQPDSEDAIDFGDDDIDFGDEPKSGSGSGSSESNGNGFVHVNEKGLSKDSDTNGSAEVIDWDMDTGSAAVEPTTSDDKIARGQEALSIMECSDTRETVVNEMCELESFLTQRLLELANENDQTNFLLDHGLTQVLGDQEKVSKMLLAVQEAVALLTSEKIKVLYMIKDNPKYIKRAVDSLKSRLDMAHKAEQKSRLMEQKEQNALDEKEQLSATIPGLLEQTRSLQSLIEGEISRRYKNRRVYLMGVQI